MVEKDLEIIANEILDAESMIETVRDACLGTEIYQYETVLNIAIEKLQDSYDKLFFMY